MKFQGFFFEREDVALPGFSKFFKKSSDEEREHAQLFMGYQNKRGGKIVLQDVAKPNRNEWGSALEAVEAALELEKTVNQVRTVCADFSTPQSAKNREKAQEKAPA